MFVGVSVPWEFQISTSRLRIEVSSILLQIAEKTELVWTLCESDFCESESSMVIETSCTLFSSVCCFCQTVSRGYTKA
jgi:hypothetical protein